VYVAVDKRWGDEGSCKVDGFGIGKALQSDVVAAQPGDDVVMNRDGGGVGMGGAVHAPISEQRGHRVITSTSVPCSVMDRR
jgi:hypothetical protein